MGHAQSIPDPYIITSSIPDRYPRGWFCIGADHEFSTQPKQMNYFGSSLVAYRSENDNRLIVLDAYCPHMGANLADGCVKGDSVICPFHEWSWGPDGKCNDIPYAKTIPERARIRNWDVTEINELCYVWHDPDGGAAIPEQAIPHDDVVAEEGWSPWIIRRVEVNSNCRELIDNMADKAHFGPIHGIHTVKHFSNISEGHRYTQHMTATSDRGDMDSWATYYGPGYMIHHISSTGNEEFAGRHSMSLVMNVPTSMDTFEFLAGFNFVVIHLLLLRRCADCLCDLPLG